MKTEYQAYNVTKSRSFQLCCSNITVLCIICFVWILAQLNLNALLTSFNNYIIIVTCIIWSKKPVCATPNSTIIPTFPVYSTFDEAN